ncbi:dihydrodipicolinate synthase family protein [Streptomyces griseocarneus]|nr:dihydrodipicolinate synthase family protein [Streptomyces griseocarneus]
MPSSDRVAAVTRLKGLRGTLVPLVTPVDGDHRVCATSVARLVESLREHVGAYVPALSTGEGWTLTPGQWHDMVRLTVEHAAGTPVLAGIALGDAAGVLDRARTAAGLGADAVVVPPPFPGPDGARRGLVEHFTEILDGSPLPVFVYHEHVVSGAPLDLAALRAVCALPGVVGVKDSSGSADFTRGLLDGGVGVPVFQGWENLITEVPGVQGFVGPLANLEPSVCDEALAAGAEDAQHRVDALSERYRLLTDDWYLHVKAELVRRGVIGTALPVG